MSIGNGHLDYMYQYIDLIAIICIVKLVYLLMTCTIIRNRAEILTLNNNQSVMDHYHDNTWFVFVSKVFNFSVLKVVIIRQKYW